MDVIYHRNCMDGAYSAYLLYLFCKTITKKGYQLFMSHLLSHTNPNLQQYLSEQTTLTQQQIITQQFFHSPCQINFHAVSMYAGDLFPIFPSSKDNILIMVDISPSTKDMMELLASRFKIVVIFDHHTTFAKMVQFVKQAGIKNVLYLWDQVKCAAQIVQHYFFKGFGFPKNFSAQFRYELQEQINYVASNDLKINQSPMSKQFTLGFYYFEIQLSHQNPLLFKRLWQLKLETIFEKGKNAYKGHLEMLKKEVQHCQVWKLQKCKFKNETFLASQSNDKGLTSDLGSILAHLSVMLKYLNLGMIYKKGHNQCRISFRSQKSLKQQPMALKISQFFGGGGHVHAAGCFLSKGTFGQHFHLVGPPKPCIKIDTKEIEQILFMKDIQPESS